MSITGIVTSLWPLCPHRKVFRRNHFTIILYHEISPERFSEHLTFLEKEYTVTHLDQLRNHYTNGTPLPENSLFITFDDGWKTNYKLMPVIEEKQAPVTVFLSTGLIGSPKKPGPRALYTDFNSDEYLTEDGEIVVPLPEQPERTMLTVDEIKEMKKLVNFQSHLVNHHLSTAIPDDYLKDEMLRSKQTIESITGKPVYAMAYPYNDAGQREAKLAEESGYTLARVGGRLLNDDKTDRYLLNCIGIEGSWSVKQLRDALIRAELKMLRVGSK